MSILLQGGRDRQYIRPSQLVSSICVDEYSWARVTFDSILNERSNPNAEIVTIN